MAARSALVALVGAGALLVADAAAAGPPTDQLRRSIELVLRVVQDPALKAEAKAAERRAMIRTVANEIFDFAEISRRSLGPHWRGRTPAEQQEFVRLFGDLLEHAYVTKIEGYSGERILYVNEHLEGEVATVRTRLVTKQGTEVPLDYRMFRQGDRWRAYDVLIEGVSLVANYRVQFNSIIRRASYQELVTRLRAKVSEPVEGPPRLPPKLEAPPAAPARARQSP